MRKFVMPDPNDRTYNEPAVLMSPAQIIGLYNQENRIRPKAQIMTPEIKSWFTRFAFDEGWEIINFQGNQCLLIVSIPSAHPEAV